MTDLKGKNVIVTGASGGIGNSIIEKLKLKSDWVSYWASMTFYLNYNH